MTLLKQSMDTADGEESMNGPLHRNCNKKLRKSITASSLQHTLSRPSSDRLGREPAISRESSTCTSPDRRPLSDSVLTQSGRSGSAYAFPVTNAAFSLAQRSGKPMLKDVISMIQRSTDGEVRSPPESECSALANCARDAYYRVIIASLGGIQAIVRTMDTFPAYEELQANACAALNNLCIGNSSNQVTTEQCGGICAVTSAMRLYPRSIAVQSAACDALMNITSMVPANIDALRQIDDFQALLATAMDRFLPPSCRLSAEVVEKRVWP